MSEGAGPGRSFPSDRLHCLPDYLPRYCVSGTVGHKILSGQRKVEVRKGKVVDVKMSVQYMSFSAHADAKGIMQLITYCQPRKGRELKRIEEKSSKKLP